MAMTHTHTHTHTHTRTQTEREKDRGRVIVRERQPKWCESMTGSAHKALTSAVCFIRNLANNSQILLPHWKRITGVKNWAKMYVRVYGSSPNITNCYLGHASSYKNFIKIRS